MLGIHFNTSDKWIIGILLIGLFFAYKNAWRTTPNEETNSVSQNAFYATSVPPNSPIATQTYPNPFSEEALKPKGQNFQNADLRNKDFKYADLQEANFRGANLSGSDFESANLQKADFFKANLSGANLKNADLDFAGFIGADLTEADLRGAHLLSTDFSGADLSRANLTGAWEVNMEYVSDLTDTIMPDGKVYDPN